MTKWTRTDLGAIYILLHFAQTTLEQSADEARRELPGSNVEKVLRDHAEQAGLLRVKLAADMTSSLDMASVLQSQVKLHAL